MKKYVFPLFAVALFSACSDEVDVVNPNEHSELITRTVLPQSRTAEDAIEIAIDAASVKSSPTSRSNSVEVENVISITSQSTSRAGIDTLMYAVNYANDNGYALIAANRNCDAVLAVTETGHFLSEEEIKNPGMRIFLDQAKTYASGIIGGGPVLPELPENPKKLDWIYEEINDSVLPRLEVAYSADLADQSVKCGTVVAAQALSFLEEPKSILLTSDGNRILDINWYAFKHLDEPICAWETANLFAFMKELSVRLDADPQTGTTYLDDVQRLLKSFVPDKVGAMCSGVPSARRLIKDAGIIVMCGIAKTNGQYDASGHAWIIDGFKYKHIIDIQYTVTIDRYTGREISRVLDYDRSRTIADLEHINWGWAGQDNGYFNHSVYKPNGGIPDEGCPVGNGDIDNNYYGYKNFYFVVK